MNTIFISNKKKTQMVAHRGLSGIELQNTTGAFIAAGNRSYYGIETDVHKTLDGKYVVIHDGHTGGVSDEKVFIKDTIFEELRKIKLGHESKGTQRIDRFVPSLDEYIRICKKYEKVSVLELKDNFSKQDITEIIEIIKNAEQLENTVFISFIFENLVTLREILPSQKAQFLCSEFNDELVKKLTEHKLDVDIEYHALNKANVKAFHKKDISVNCWTVNSADDAKNLIKMGVDYITSNILE